MRMRTRTWTAIVLLVTVTLGASAVAWAQTGGGYDASFNAFDAGGKTVSSGSYVLQTGVGQPMAGNVTGGSYSVDIGVLAGGAGAAGASPTPPPGSLGPYKLVAPQLAKD